MSRSRRGLAANREYSLTSNFSDFGGSDDNEQWQPISYSRSKKSSDGDDLKISSNADDKCDVVNMNSTSTKRKRGGVCKSDYEDMKICAEVNEKRDEVSMDSISTRRKRASEKCDAEDVKMSANTDVIYNEKASHVISTPTKRRGGVYKADGDDVKISAEADQKCDLINMESTTSTKRKRMVYKTDWDDIKISVDAQRDVNSINEKSSNETADDEIKTCSICLETPQQSECAKLDGCSHLFCFGCIDKWSQRENTCPLCKFRFNKIERLLKAEMKGKKRKGQNAASSKKIKNRDQSADLYDHSSIQSLFASLHASGALPPQIADALFSARGLFQGNPFATARSSSRNGTHGVVSSASDSAAPFTGILSVRQTSFVQRRAPSSVQERNELPFIRFFHHQDSMNNDDDNDEIGFFPSVIARSFRISTAAGGSSSSITTVDLSSSPQRSYVVRGQGSAERPLEIADSDDE